MAAAHTKLTLPLLASRVGARALSSSMASIHELPPPRSMALSTTADLLARAEDRRAVIAKEYARQLIAAAQAASPGGERAPTGN
jgi:hypothetical protein